MARLTITIIVMVLTMSGCASMNSDFNCPAGKGVGCKSIHEVNQMVNEGKLTSKKQSDVVKIKPIGASTHGMTPKRTNEKVLSIWIAPYEDKSGNYHDASTVHTVVKNSAWAATNQKGDN